jgi:hypothetical protein
LILISATIAVSFSVGFSFFAGYGTLTVVALMTGHHFSISAL